MKKFTLLSVVLSLFLLTSGLQAQSIKAMKPNLNQKGEIGIGQLPVNSTVRTKSVLDDPTLMTTRYDMQSNASSENRIHLFPDGTVGAVTTMSHEDSFNDRGTGINFFNGTEWGPPPAARIETTKSGWPSYAPWGPDGEIVVNHHMTAGLYVMTRETKGTGTWNEAILPGPPTAVDISWPRVVTNGPDNMYVHIICLTWVSYQGMDNAFLYYRSLDGGVTWDIQHRIIEGMSSADYLNFGADTYAWAKPIGDTLAFVFGDSWMDLAVMKSYNNGLDWEKTVIWPCPYNLTPITGPIDDFLAPDGTVAVALDKYGKAHVATGLMNNSADDLGNKLWTPQTHGLIYWNEDKPQLPEVLDWDELYNDGTIIGTVADTSVLDPDPAVYAQVAFYYNSMTSQPTICVDDDDYVFVFWSGVTTNTDHDNFFMRHIYGRGSSDYGTSWTTSQLDLTSDVLYTWSECVYPSVSFTSDDYLYIIFQEDDYAGIALLAGSGYQGQTSIGENYIKFLRPSKMDILFPVGTDKKPEQTFRVSQNYPNPVTNFTTISVDLTQTATLNLEVTNLMGQRVETLSKGSCAAGNYSFTINTRGLSPGVYFYTVTCNNEKVTKKMVVE